MSEGDEMSVVILGNQMDFKVERVSPKSIVEDRADGQAADNG